MRERETERERRESDTESDRESKKERETSIQCKVLFNLWKKTVKQ